MGAEGISKHSVKCYRNKVKRDAQKTSYAVEETIAADLLSAHDGFN